MNFKYKEITEKIIGSTMKVHSLALQMQADNIYFIRECYMPILYLEQQIGERRVDFFVEDKICVKLKAIIGLEPVHFAQARNYLEAFNIETGLLINFRAISLQFKRLANAKFNPSIIHHPQNPNHPLKS